MRLRLDERALHDFLDAVDYYSDESIPTAERFIVEIETALDAISLFPKRFGLKNESVRANVRTNFPYTIFYSIEEEEVVVLAIGYHSQDASIWKDRLPKHN